jgi:ABC-type glycerol-3-phosphate transport system substrate-binding protein
MKIPKSIDRRRFLGTAAKATAAVVAAPYVHTSHAAGKLAVGFWDHWVPGANDTLTKLCKEWAAKEKVDLKIDYITSQGRKLLLTVTSQGMAKSGHDVLPFATWTVAAQQRNLEPVDDIMKPLIQQNGKVVPVVEYLGKLDDRWYGVPATPGSQMKGPCARIDLFKKHAGLDLTRMYPAAGKSPDKELVDNWTWETFLKVAEKCNKGGHPFGLGLGSTADSVDWAGSMFSAYGAELVNSRGDITVDSDATREAMEYAKRLAAQLPQAVYAWDDSSNNKWLISGRGALIMNPPSAWAVAKRDNPDLARQLWSFPAPGGPKGRHRIGLPFHWGIWKFSKNKSAAKSLLVYLSQRNSVEQLVNASGGYDVPGFSSFRDFKIWEEAGPPKGTLYNYPPRGDQNVSIAGAPAPPVIANQIFTQATMTKMIARYTQSGQSLNKVIGWASSELEGFMRV